MEVRDFEVLAWRLFEESNDAVFIVDCETEQIRQANPAAQRLTGMRWRQLRDRNLDELVHSRESGKMSQLLAAVRATGFFHSQEEYLLDRNESEPLSVNISVSRVHAPSGELGLVVARDISERTAAERALSSFNNELERQVLQQTEQLRELNLALERRVAERTAELQESNSELRAFTGSVSHDLRAPLRAMAGFAAALVEDYGEQLDGEAHEYIQHIVDAAKRMDLLIHDLLAYSRLGQAKLPLSLVDLNTVVTESLEQLGGDIEAYHAELNVEKPMPSVLGHKTTLVQIVTNLVSNGMKFVAAGVRPEVRVWTECKSDGYVRLRVADNGIGIDDACKDRIFGVFERLHGIERYPGTGIGLAIVARACTRTGGRYGVESRPARGSCFWVDLPAKEKFADLAPRSELVEDDPAKSER